MKVVNPTTAPRASEENHAGTTVHRDGRLHHAVVGRRSPVVSRVLSSAWASAGEGNPADAPGHRDSRRRQREGGRVSRWSSCVYAPAEYGTCRTSCVYAPVEYSTPRASHVYALAECGLKGRIFIPAGQQPTGDERSYFCLEGRTEDVLPFRQRKWGRQLPQAALRLPAVMEIQPSGLFRAHNYGTPRTSRVYAPAEYGTRRTSCVYAPVEYGTRRTSRVCALVEYGLKSRIFITAGQRPAGDERSYFCLEGRTEDVLPFRQRKGGRQLPQAALRLPAVMEIQPSGLLRGDNYGARRAARSYTPAEYGTRWTSRVYAPVECGAPRTSRVCAPVGCGAPRVLFALGAGGSFPRRSVSGHVCRRGGRHQNNNQYSHTIFYSHTNLFQDEKTLF
jgi:hypothetical protein